MQRRRFLTHSVLAAGGVVATSQFFSRPGAQLTSVQQGPISSFEPVTQDLAPEPKTRKRVNGN